MFDAEEYEWMLIVVGAVDEVFDRLFHSWAWDVGLFNSHPILLKIDTAGGVVVVSVPSTIPHSADKIFLFF